MLVTKRELDNYYEEEIDIIIEKEEKIRNKKRKKAKSSSKLFAISLAVIILVLCLYILYGYTNITNMRLEISELEKQRYELERDKEDLIAQLETIKSSSTIEENAMVKLGMDYPTEEQLIYLSIDQADENYDIVAEKEIPIAKQVINIFNFVLGFFRGA